MKLSESLMMASVVDHHPLSNDTWQTCLIGMSLCAFGKPLEEGASSEAIARWPWLLERVNNDKVPPCVDYAKNIDYDDRTGFYVVICLCNEVLRKRITLEQAIDAIRAIEPEEETHEDVRVSRDRELRELQVPEGEITHV